MENSTAHRVIKNTGYLYAKMGITMFVSLYTTRLILNGLGAADFGIFNIVGGAIAMLGFLNAAMASATQRFMSYAEGEGNKEKQKYIFNISIVLHAAIAAIVGIALVGAGYFFFNGVLNIPADRTFAAQVVYGSLIISTMFTVMSVPYDAALNAHENMRYYALVGILESFLKLAVAFACVYTASDKLIVYGILMACIPLFTLSIMRVYCHKHYEECTLAPRRYYDKTLMKEMTGFAGWTFTTTATSMATQYGFGIVINHFFGVLLNAAQGIAGQLSGMLMAFSANAQKAFNPILIKSEGGGHRESLIYGTIVGCKVSFFIFGLFSLPFILMMPEILKIWLENVPEWAVLFCRLQLLRTLLEQITLNLTTALNAEGNIKSYSITRSVLYILPLILTIIAFSLGARPYWMYIIWIFFWCILGGFCALYFCKKNAGIQYPSYIKGVLLPAAIISITSILPYLICSLFTNNITIKIFCTGLQIVLYLITSYKFLATKDERKVLLKIIQK